MKLTFALALGTIVAASASSLAGAATATRTGTPCDRSCILVCGPAGCSETYNAAALVIPFTYSRSVARASAVPPQSYYVITQNVPPGENPAAQTTYYIPQASLIRIPGGNGALATWVRLSRAAASALHETASHVDPYPATTKLTTVIVDHSLADNPNSYLRLWTIGKPVSRAASAGGWLPIRVSSDQASPWTDGLISLAVSRHGAYLKREGQLYAIPAALASRVRAGRSIPK